MGVFLTSCGHHLAHIRVGCTATILIFSEFSAFCGVEVVGPLFCSTGEVVDVVNPNLVEVSQPRMIGNQGERSYLQVLVRDMAGRGGRGQGRGSGDKFEEGN
jgi:hypothetical protein